MPIIRKRHLHLPKPNLWWVFAIFYTLCLWFLFFGPTLRLKQISCQTNTLPDCPDYIVPELSKHKGKLIYLLDRPVLASKIKASLPHAKELVLSTKWPDRLVVNIIWQTPVANLTSPISSNVIILGENGQILDTKPQPDPNLPIVVASAAAELIISDTIEHPTLLTALTLIQHLPQIIGSNITSIEAKSALEIRVVDQNNRKYLFTSAKAVEPQLHALQLISSQTTMNSTAQVIDLRYDRPALKSSW